MPVDPANPGQFFACCGLLELADRLWDGAEGWFEPDAQFCCRPDPTRDNPGQASLMDEIARCPLTNTMTDTQLARRAEMARMPKGLREADPDLVAEKKLLDVLWRESPVLLGSPFHLRVDWFLDRWGGGKSLKTWAGQQSVIEISNELRRSVGPDTAIAGSDLMASTSNTCVPFNFDSDLGGSGSDIDIGFSFDPLKATGLTVISHPLVELLAFVGLQRFRPAERDGVYSYSTWSEPLVPGIAATVAVGATECLIASTFRFRLLYRTKYLKSFLPARRIQRRSNGRPAEKI
jgi:CRISPR-associated protein Csb3